MVTVLNKQNSIFNQFLSEARDANIQKDALRFRLNLERMGNIFAYEISKSLNYQPVQIATPLGIADENLISEVPVIVSILRAGLPIHEGMLHYFDKAESGFISVYRNHEKEGKFSLKTEYVSCPELDGKTLILVDALIASGSSILMAYNSLLQYGTPAVTHIISLIASKEGLNFLRKKLSSQNVKIWLGAVDEELTVKSFVVPGMGDAGDLAYGSKPQSI